MPSLAELSQAAIIGATLSAIADRSPMLTNLRQNNPTLYDAAIAASAMAVMNELHGQDLNVNPTGYQTTGILM